ncbi:sensor domain-containing diguanylate cyclase [Aestuariibacter salexigens]|uniref:sensor domain-containing diguanylate cyclase n=1 Tax=Aestuariibacter salexigens TaxID=226010 RepID=UPI0004283F53|nr:diguanylate cyclase [Aestuariibacter salexigens]
MRSFRYYSVYFFVVYSAALISVFLCYRVFIEYPSELATVEEHQRRELESLRASLAQKFKSLQAITTDWAHWTDTMQFVLSPSENQDYIDENILPSTFETFDLIAIVYFDKNFEVVFSVGYSEQEEELTETDELIRFPIEQTLNEGIKPGDAWESHGWMSTNAGPTAFAIQYISDSNLRSAPVGYLMFVQKITDDHIDRIESLTRLKIDFIPTSLKDPQTHGVVSLMTPQLVEGFQLQRKRLLDDFKGTPIMLLNIQHDPISHPQLVGWSAIIILFLLVVVVIDKTLIRQLSRNTQKINAMIENGRLELLPQKFPVFELEQIRRVFNKSVTLVNEQQESLKHLSLTDELTGIANRRAFNQYAQNAWHHALRSHELFLIVTLDIDYFKNYNDALGHPQGDIALQKVAEALRAFCRRSGEICARIGGEEFAMVVCAEHRTHATQRVDDICHAVKDLAIPHPASGVSDVITCSIGALCIEKPDSELRHLTLDDLLAKVDKELYRAKQQGRNRVSFKSVRADII